MKRGHRALSPCAYTMTAPPYGGIKGCSCMKPFCVFTALFLLAGVCSVAAQDLIVLRDGNVIEAKVTEISQTEIRYKRFDNLNGPTIVIPIASVLSIRYENGTYEIFNADTATEQENAQTEKPKNTAMNPDKLNFGVNFNPSGFLLFGPSVTMEFSKGNSNTEINFLFPSAGLATSEGDGGVGLLLVFNRFWHKRNGGFYFGFGGGFIWIEDAHSYTAYNYKVIINGQPDLFSGYTTYTKHHDAYIMIFGLNIGYKFVTQSGFYFRTGGLIGGGYDFGYNSGGTFYFKPDVTIGLTSRGYARNLTPQTYSANF